MLRSFYRWKHFIIIIIICIQHRYNVKRMLHSVVVIMSATYSPNHLQHSTVEMKTCSILFRFFSVLFPAIIDCCHLPAPCTMHECGLDLGFEYRNSITLNFNPSVGFGFGICICFWHSKKFQFVVYSSKWIGKLNIFTACPVLIGGIYIIIIIIIKLNLWKSLHCS